MKLCANGISRANVKAPDGTTSQLYTELLDSGLSRDQALAMYVRIHGKEFKNNIYNWEIDKAHLNEQGEPKLSNINKYLKGSRINTPLLASNTTNDTQENTAENDEDINVDENEVPEVEDEVEDMLNIGAKGLDAKAKLKENEKIRFTKLYAVINNQIHNLNIAIAPLKGKHDKDSIRERNNLTVELNKLLRIKYQMDADNFKTTSINDIIEIANTSISHMHDVMNTRPDRIGLKELNTILSYLKVWEQAKTIFLNNNERHKTNPETIISLNRVQNNASSANDKLVEIMLERISNVVKNTLKIKDAYTVTDEFNKFKDIGPLHRYAMHIGRDGLRVFNLLEKLHGEGIVKANAKISAISSDIDNMFKGIKDYDQFMEKYSDGTATGNIIARFAPEYNIARQKAEARFTRDADTFDDLGLLKWLHENNMIIDPRVFFADYVHTNEDGSKVKVYDGKLYGTAFDISSSTGDLSKAKNDLIDILGHDAFNKLLDRAKSKVERYAEEREHYLADLNDQIKSNVNGMTKSKATVLMTEWEAKNSPFVYAYNITNNMSIPITTKSATTTAEYVSHFIANESSVEMVPRKYYLSDTGRTTDIKTGWYNEDFAKIESNPKLLKIHNYITDLNHQLRLLLPAHIGNNINDNFLMQIKKTVLEIYKDDGNMKSEIKDKMLKLLASHANDGGENYNPYTKEKQFTLNIPALDQHRAAVNLATQREILKFTETNGKAPTAEETVDIRKDVMNKLALGNSFSLPDVLKMWAYNVHMFAEKADIADIVKSTRIVVGSMEETIRSDKFEHKTRRLAATDSFRNSKGQLEYWVESFFGYNKPKKKVVDKHIYNDEDKAADEELNDLLNRAREDMQRGENGMTEELFENIENEVINIKRKLGYEVTYDQIGNTLLRMVQFKGMGYNISAAGTNIMHGYINAMIEANDGRLFNRLQLLRAYKDMWGSFVRFYSVGAVNTSFATKVRNIISNYDLLSEASRELGHHNVFKKRNLATDPYYFQNRSEYVNQAPIVIAILRNVKIDVVENGTKVTKSLLDLMDDNGSLDPNINYFEDAEGWVGKDGNIGSKLSEALYKASRAITIVHGNYNQHLYLEANSNVFYKGLKQFRTWMFEAFAHRFERHKYDDILEMHRKGMYRTGLGVISFTKFNKDGETGNYINPTLFALGNLAKSLIFIDTNFDSKFKAVDAANFRALLAEVRINIYLSQMLLLISMGLGGSGDDDDESRVGASTKQLLRYAYNTNKRLLDDINLYSSPSSFETITKNLIPVFSLIIEIADVLDATALAIAGKDTIKGGIYDGQSRLLRSLGKLTPPFNRYMSIEAMQSQLFTSKTSVIEQAAKGIKGDDDK